MINRRTSSIAVALACFSTGTSHSQTIAEAPTPILRTASLAPADRELADELLLRMLDGEGLYTLLGGIKPTSNGIWRTPLAVESPNVAEIDRMRRAISFLRTEEYWADVVPFTHDNDGKRYAEIVVVHRPSLARLVREHAEFFGPHAITPSSHPLQVLVTVEYLGGLDMHLGYGYLFGYPAQAVHFYVESLQSSEEGGEFVPRDFRRIPTFGSRGSFVWAVPKGQRETDEEREIRVRAKELLDEYERRRSKHINPGGSGALELLEEWLQDRRDDG